MMVLMLGAGLCLLPLTAESGGPARLGIPLVYVLLMLTVFHGWYQAHTALADGILLAMVGVAALLLGGDAGAEGGRSPGMRWRSTPRRSGLPSCAAGQGRGDLRSGYGRGCGVNPGPSAPG